MILVAAALLAFGVADLIGQLLSRRPRRATVTAACAGAGAVASLAALCGASVAVCAIGGVTAGIVCAAWRVSCAYALNGRGVTLVPLTGIGVVLGAAFASSGSADELSGPLERWYAGIDLAAARGAAADQFVLGVCVAIFLMSSANQIVRLILQTAGTPAAEGETTLRGGRYLGPLERLFIAAMVLGGDVTGAAIVIAGKGLLRLPEIRSREEEHRGAGDFVTEYFLIGTFSSLMLAGGLAGLVLAAG